MIPAASIPAQDCFSIGL